MPVTSHAPHHPPPRPSSPPHVDRDAIAEGVRRFLSDLLTEPLSERQTADLFDVTRPVAKRLLETIPGVVPVTCGSLTRYRIPVRHCPPAYFEGRNLPVPGGKNTTTYHHEPRAGKAA